DCDNVAVSLGITPRLDKLGRPIPVGKKEGKGHVYVVWTGRAIGLFYNWGLTQCMVCGFSGANFKKYDNYELAVEAWFEGPPRLKGNWKVPNPRPPILTSPLQKEKKSPHPTPSTYDGRLPPEVKLSATEDDDDGDYDYGSAAFDAAEEDDNSWQLYHDAPGSVSTPSPQSSPTPRTNPRAASDLSNDSPYIHSVRSFEFSPMLTAGTISPRTVQTPSPSSPALSTGILSPPQLAQPSPSSPAINKKIRDDRLTQLAYDLANKSSITRKRKVYVVLRGERPGIYFERGIALDMLGTKPGIKLVLFKSLSRAAWYFVQQYMAGHVGVPVLTLANEEWLNGQN
ncbi:hypothetical protein C8Q73DRAFT_660296, partial [Cubamyces lactineus]